MNQKYPMLVCKHHWGEGYVKILDDLKKAFFKKVPPRKTREIKAFIALVLRRLIFFFWWKSFSFDPTHIVNTKKHLCDVI